MKNVFIVAALICVTHTVLTQQMFKTPSQPALYHNTPSLLEQSPQTPQRIYPSLSYSPRELADINTIDQEIEYLKNQRRHALSNIIGICTKIGISVAAFITISILLNKLRVIYRGFYEVFPEIELRFESNGFITMIEHYPKTPPVEWIKDRGICLGTGAFKVYITPLIQKYINMGISAAALASLLPALCDYRLYRQLSARQEELENSSIKEKKPNAEKLAMLERYKQVTEEAETLKRQLDTLAQPKKRGLLSQCTIV